MDEPDLLSVVDALDPDDLTEMQFWENERGGLLKTGQLSLALLQEPCCRVQDTAAMDHRYGHARIRRIDANIWTSWYPVPSTSCIIPKVSCRP